MQRFEGPKVRRCEGFLFRRLAALRSHQRYVYTLSRYLTGRAYNYYTQKVALTEERWTLAEFFQGMFNYCFPADYRTKLRAKLDRLSQNSGQSVTEYIYELEELCNLLGDVSERDRTIRFWNGLRSKLQQALWRDKLSPETSSWKDVIAQAETIEISHNVANSYSQSNRKNSENRKTYRLSFKDGHRANQHSKGPRHPADHQPKKESYRPKRKGLKPHFSSKHQQDRRADDKSKKTDHQNKERTKQIAEGRCFVCNDTGHFS